MSKLPSPITVNTASRLIESIGRAGDMQRALDRSAWALSYTNSGQAVTLRAVNEVTRILMRHEVVDFGFELSMRDDRTHVWWRATDHGKPFSYSLDFSRSLEPGWEDVLRGFESTVMLSR